MSRQRYFTVDGKPFFSLGGQVFNSSAYTMREMETAWKALEVLHGNTLEVPIYWEQVEPVQGQFDFTIVGQLLEEARKRGVKLILLWFATWKNATQKYTPEWVKADKNRYRRIISPAGEALPTLSPHCRETWEADRNAFCAFMTYLHAHDRQYRTVIAVQVENEPGNLGSDRDYSPAAEELFAGQVPDELRNAVQSHPDSMVHAMWKQAGARPSGTWAELFDVKAGELFSAWHIARFIHGLAEEGKRVYDIPMYANVWLDDARWRLTGLNYPSGGAVPGTLDIWKWAGSALDLVAPDIYIGNLNLFNYMCASYGRDDNPLFVPESAVNEANALNMFSAIGNFNAIGYHIFGIEQLIDPDGTPREEHRAVIGSFRCTAQILPLLLEYQGTGRIHAVIQEEFMGHQYFDFGNYWGIVKFQGGERRDFHHWLPGKKERGRGLLVQAGDREFYLAGAGFRLHLIKKASSHIMLSATRASDGLLARMVDYIRVEEGHFDTNGEWVTDRKRNGDESDFGIWAEADVGVVRVVMVD